MMMLDHRTLLAQCCDLGHLPDDADTAHVVELQAADLLDDYGRLTTAGYRAIRQARSEEALLRAAAAGVLLWRDHRLFVGDYPFPLPGAGDAVGSLTQRQLLDENPDGSHVNRVTITEKGRWVLAGDDELDVTGSPLIGPWTALALALLVGGLAWAAVYAVLWGLWRGWGSWL